MIQAEHDLIWSKVRELFSDEHARFWLTTPNRHLDGRIPRECGFKEVFILIEKIKMGAFNGASPVS